MMSRIIWIASYPKSGNTWVRFLLAHLLAPDLNGSADVARIIPDIHHGWALPGVEHRGCGFMKTHFLPEQLPPNLPTAAAVYVVRDPRDVIVSHLNYLNVPQELRTGFIDRFIEAGGLQRWTEIGFGTWPQHIDRWLLQPQPFPRLLIRYEDLHADTAGQTARLCRFLNLPASSQRIEEVCQRCTFAAMRQIEEVELGGHQAGIFLTVQRRQSPPPRFMHQGKIGCHVQILTAEQVHAANRRFGPLMRWLGYLNVAESSLDRM